jgi:hypothetical protein
MDKKSFVIGFLVASLIFATVASAATSTQIDVNFRNLRYLVDGRTFVPPEGLDGFIYNNRTYVPLRFVAESLDYAVSWDGSTSTITMQESDGGIVDSLGKPLQDVNLFSTSGGFVYWGVRSTRLSNGTEYDSGIEIAASPDADKKVTLEYLLNRQYDTFRAVFGQTHSSREQEGTAELEIYGDGTLLETVELDENDRPVSIEVDISGVSKLLLDFDVTENLKGYGVGLVEPTVFE